MRPDSTPSIGTTVEAATRLVTLLRAVLDVADGEAGEHIAVTPILGRRNGSTVVWPKSRALLHLLLAAAQNVPFARAP